MFDFLKNALAPAREGMPARGHDDIRIATCALFLELASIDNEFSDEERQSILSLLQSEYGLSDRHALELAEAAVEELGGSIDVWQFTNQINENYSDAEKMRVVELLWRLVYVDGKLDAHEDYLMHKIGRLLRFPHKDLIAAKIKVLRETQ
jgi:uncharacterized tellurite resistance protein B-like protein